MRSIDPSTRRARNLVVLVVALVAVPSMLLTALGAVAVNNEEAAAKGRLERLYKPVLDVAAGRFNKLVDATLAASEAPLTELMGLARGDAPGEALQAYVAATPFAVNFFVVGPAGEVILPAGDAATPLPPPWRAAVEGERGHLGDAKACGAYRALASNAPPGSFERCLATYAQVSCEQGFAAGAAAAEPSSASCLLLEGELIDAAAKLAHAARARPLVPAQLTESASPLISLLREPTARFGPWLHELVARRAAALLAGVPGHTAERLVSTLNQLAERPRLLAHLTRMSHRRHWPAAISAPRLDGEPRLLITAAQNGYVAGVELAPALIEPILDDALRQVPAGEAMGARLFVLGGTCCITPTDAEYAAHVLSWALLKKTELTWEIALWLESDGRWITGASRTSLYLWGLILIALVLVVGIVYTVRAVISEARQSRLKTDFVSSASHDLRTPLTSIRMYTDTLLLGRTRSRAEERECLETIAQEAERLSRLTERILDFSRMEAGRKAYNLRPQPVASLVQQALAACKPMLSHAGFEVQLELPADLDSVTVDRDAIIEALINLVSNAVKYSPEERHLTITGRREGPEIVIAVSDRGMGIAKSEHRRIFEKFYRVDCRRTTEVDGCGIGLSLVQHIITAHGGRITVDSTPGQGSTFRLILPAAPEASVASRGAGGARHG